ncbi:MAG TPA: aminotransferase class V-fold PLP-dependent enzyme [Candidatus Eisenbacteria bacterium]|jgi:selenocysteine lyase/cysteine desulfurase
MLDRRSFLARTGAALAVSALPSPLLAAVRRRTPPPADLGDWRAVRAQFALAPGQLHFASFYLASHPRPVREAIEAFRRTLDEEPFLTVEHRMFEPGEQNLQFSIRDEIAPYLGAKRDEIALTGNTTTGLALVYAGLALKAGDEILTTTHDHYSHHESIRFAAARAGARARRVPLYDRSGAADAGEIADRLRRAIAPATRVVGVTWVHSSTGVRLPIPALAQVVADANRGRAESDRILLVVDGVHGLGVADETVAALGCDFFCAGTHKWMFAPRGTGLVWGRAEAWARLSPVIPTFASMEVFQRWMNDDRSAHTTTAYDMSPGGFHAYEHEWAMSAAFQFHERMGRSRVAARIRALNDRCKQGLAEMHNVTLHTPRDPALSAGLVAFEVAGVSSEAVVARLLERHIVASTAPYKLDYARLAPSLVNDEAEVEAALRAVREIAGV